MTANPYDVDEWIFNDDADDDNPFLPGAEASEEIGTDKPHTFDGTECPRCGVVHAVFSDGSLPDELLEEVAEFLDSVPSSIRKNVKIYVKELGRDNPTRRAYLDVASASIALYYRTINSVNYYAPILRAIVDAMPPEQAERVAQLLPAYRAEHEISHVNILMNTMSAIRDQELAVLTAADGLDEAAQFRLSKIDEIIESLALTMGTTQEHYTQICAEQGLEPNPQIFTDPSFATDPSPINQYIQHQVTSAEILGAAATQILSYEDTAALHVYVNEVLRQKGFMPPILIEEAQQHEDAE